MGLPRSLLHLGDLDLILPAAAAILAWLLAGRAWRLAFWWSLLYALAVLVVGTSKIAYMGWGQGVPALAFKSVSGHATGAMAVYPMLLYLLLQGAAPRLRQAALALGVTVALTLAVLLVEYDEHSAAEALAGCVLGATASLGALRMGRTPGDGGHAAPGRRDWRDLRDWRYLRDWRDWRYLRDWRHWREWRDRHDWRTLALAAVAFALLAWLMRHAHPGYWMIKAARALSGNHHLYPLTID